MDYEKKYKDALERAKEISTTLSERAMAEYIFPELKESKDERIRKAIITYISYGQHCNVSNADMVAWLEKQNSPVLSNSSNIGKSENCSADKGVTCTQEVEVGNGNIKALVTEEIPTDKVEPKFHEGDWIVDVCGFVWKIEEILGQCYRLEADDGAESLPTIGCIDKTSHLWTIADAKEGDILVASDESIFIYANSTDRYAKFHLALTKYGQLNVDRGNWEDKNSVHPATIEQRGTLIKAMADAGWKFDFERKELRKIEPKTLDADKVIEWLNENVADFWKSPCNPQNVIDKFKEYFGL